MMYLFVSIVGGYYKGLRGGVLIGTLGIPFNVALMYLFNPTGMSTLSTLPSIMGHLAVIVVGGAIGLVQDLRLQIRGELEERIQAETSLYESEDRFRELFERAPDAMLTVNKLGTVTSANRAALKLSGYTRDEVVGRHFTKVSSLRARDIPTYMRIFSSALMGGIPEPFEVSIINVDGTSRWAEAHTSLLERGEETVGYQIVLRDITERKKIEEELDRRFRELSIINEASISLATEVDLNRTLTSTLEYSLDLTGGEVGYVGLINEEGFLEIPPSCFTRGIWERCNVEAMGSDEPLVFKKFIGLFGWGLTQREAVLSNDPASDPRSTGVPQGHLPLRNFLAVPILYGGELVGQIGVANKEGGYDERDTDLLRTLANAAAALTHRSKQMDVLEMQNMRLQRLDEMKSRFVSTATHELRTPVVSIRGYIDFILSGRAGEISERIESMLKIVQRNTDRLSGLTNDLLDIQRIESGRLTITPEPMDIGEVVKEVVEEILPLISERDQELHVEILEELPIIIADPIRISQILINLLNNAYQYTPEGGEINLKVNEAPGSVRVEVSDTGIGIKKEDLPKLFSPFPDMEKTSRNGGTGLGLSICKGIIDLHGGTILAESEGENKGSTFTITLPKQEGTGF